VLLVVLLAVAILMLLYFIDINALFGPSIPPKKRSAKHRPWLEEDRIVPSDRLIKPSEPPKPELNKPFTLTAPVFLDDSERGTVALDFTVAGEVSGSWHCEYSHDNRNYTFDATFTGNIDVTKTYVENDEANKSKLYFITKGNYTQTVYNVEASSETSDQGLVYVTGWLGPDYSAEGLITITTDKTWSATYTWQINR